LSPKGGKAVSQKWLCKFACIVEGPSIYSIIFVLSQIFILVGVEPLTPPCVRRWNRDWWWPRRAVWWAAGK